MSVFLATDGTVIWGKEAISNDKLRSQMKEASNLNPVPQIVLEVSPATSCQRVREVRAIMDQAPMCKGRYSRCSEGSNPKEWPMFGGP
jgi:biopolymer transport protein ExbD